MLLLSNDNNIGIASCVAIGKRFCSPWTISTSRPYPEDLVMK